MVALYVIPIAHLHTIINMHPELTIAMGITTPMEIFVASGIAGSLPGYKIIIL